jgi:hypothetical protein
MLLNQLLIALRWPTLKFKELTMVFNRLYLVLIIPLLVACFAGSNTTPTPSAPMTPTPGLAGLPTPFSTPSPISYVDPLESEEAKRIFNDRGILAGYHKTYLFSFIDDEAEVAPYENAPILEDPEKTPQKDGRKTFVINSVEDLLTQLNWRKKGGSEQITDEDREFVKAYANSRGMDFERYTYLYCYRMPNGFPVTVGVMSYGAIAKIVESATNPEQLDVDFYYDIYGEPGRVYIGMFPRPLFAFQLAMKKTTRTKVNFIYKRSYTGIPLSLERKMAEGRLKYTYF